MPSVRSIILLATTVLVISLLIHILSLLRTPDSGGTSADSYGTRGFGFRGIHDVLSELGIPTRREFAPPRADGLTGTLAIVAPQSQLLRHNPVYLQELNDWLEGGGRILLAIRAEPKDDFMSALFMEETGPRWNECLGLADVQVEEVRKVAGYRLSPGDEATHIVDLEEPNWDEVEQASETPLRNRRLSEQFQAWMEYEETPPITGSVTLEGSFAAWEDALQAVTVPSQRTGTLSWDTSQPTGMLAFRDKQGRRIVVAAEFRRGQGSVVVLAIPEVLSNKYLGLADNAILAVRLLAPQAEEVVFDEFYHGLGVRGDIFYLFTRPGFAGAALGLLLLVGVRSWRAGVLIGPALEEREKSRREIGEYLSAMGHFFSRGRRMRPFLVRRMRDGVLRELSLQHALPPETHDVDLVAAVIARRDPGQAERLRKTVGEIDRALEAGPGWSKSQTLESMRRLTACLSKNV